ncbi:hypothetical protein ACTXGL_09835 [Psychrobacter sp. T6-6]|uniref:hypothetical protein n=1 Tax=Psychrobacter sp. T6-6 TaxID=3457452 RepID=UPI003FCFDA20
MSSYTKAEKLKQLRKRAAELDLTFRVGSFYINNNQSYEIIDRTSGVRVAKSLTIDSAWDDHENNDFMSDLAKVEIPMNAHLTAIKKEKMANLKKTTDFDHNYHNSQKHSSSNMSEYVRHNLDVYNQVMGLDAVYQNGQSYYHGDHSLPSTQLELSDLGGTDARLLKINALYESDFDKASYAEYLQEIIDDLALDEVKTIDDLFHLYVLLMDNNGFANTYADNLDIKPVFNDHE